MLDAEEYLLLHRTADCAVSATEKIGSEQSRSDSVRWDRRDTSTSTHMLHCTTPCPEGLQGWSHSTHNSPHLVLHVTSRHLVAAIYRMLCVCMCVYVCVCGHCVHPTLDCCHFCYSASTILLLYCTFSTCYRLETLQIVVPLLMSSRVGLSQGAQAHRQTETGMLILFIESHPELFSFLSGPVTWKWWW